MITGAVLAIAVIVDSLARRSRMSHGRAQGDLHASRSDRKGRGRHRYRVGIGLECARILHEAGARVVLVDRAADRLATLSAELGVEHVVVDLLDKASVATMVPAILDKMGQLDIFHANAGAYVGGDVHGGDPDAWDRMLNLNINAVFRTIHAVLPHMVERAPATSSSPARYAGALGADVDADDGWHARGPGSAAG